MVPAVRRGARRWPGVFPAASTLSEPCAESVARLDWTMHDVLRARVMRKIESLPEVQMYQVLDYIEFLESKYAADDIGKQASGLQRLAEGLEDKLRKRAFNPSNVREAFQFLAAADRAISGVTQAGREILGGLAEGAKGDDPPAKATDGSRAACGDSPSDGGSGPSRRGSEPSRRSDDAG